MLRLRRAMTVCLVAVLMVGLWAVVPTAADADPGCANATGDSGKKVCVREAPNPQGNAKTIRDLLTNAKVPASVINSRLTQGPLSNHMAGLPALRDAAASLAARPETYTGQATIVTQGNLNSLRGRIAGNGGTFVFRGNIELFQLNQRIEVGSNTTVWIDGTVYYKGPAPKKRGGDQYSVADSIEGLFEVTNGKKSNIKFFGTKRSNVISDGKLKGVNINATNGFEVRGINFTRSRNAMYAGGSSNGVFEGNFVVDSARRGAWLKNTNQVDFVNNLIIGSEVDGIDIDAFAKNADVKGNVVGHNGDRFMYWNEIAVQNIVTDGNIGYFMKDRLGKTLGIQENGSETTQPPTKNNTWTNNHIFYSDQNSYNRGFVMNSKRRIERNTIKFFNNYVWQSVNAKLRYEDPKPDRVDDVIFYLAPKGNQPVPAPGPAPTPPGKDNPNPGGGSDGGSGDGITCAVEGPNRQAATDEFRTRCGGFPVDCDPIAGGREVCADANIPNGTAGDVPTGNPTPTPTPNPAPEPSNGTCSTFATNRAEATKAFYQKCAGQKLVDCDPINGGELCSNEWIGTPPPGANPAPAPAPTPTPGGCTADGSSLGQARSNFRKSCSKNPVDCDPIGGGRWRCASSRIGKY